ncbi:MAG TPA: ATP-grasp domain-containing protein [Polyangiaceae bacterium]
MIRPLRVAVSGIHVGENPQPGAGVIRSLREAFDDVFVVGLAYDAFDSGLYAVGLVDEAFLVPYPSAGPAAYLERLLDIHESCPFDVLIPCLDVELPILVRISPSLAELGIRVVLPSSSALAQRSKEQLPELAERFGVKTPETISIGGTAALASAGLKLGYPMVVKGPFYEAEVVNGPQEAAGAFDKLAARWGLPLLAQRFVVGDEYDVIALGDGTGGVHGAVAMRKTIVSRLGKAWGAMTVSDPAVLETARRVVSGLEWRGGCEVELLKTRDDEIYLIEVNPRLPAWVYLATAAGVNLPAGLVRMALSQPIPAYSQYRAGVFHVRHATEVIGNISDIEALTALGHRHSVLPRPEAPAAPRIASQLA